MDSIRYESNKTLEIEKERERERERCTFSILNKKRKVSVKKFKGGIYDTPTKQSFFFFSFVNFILHAGFWMI